jgi:membrane protease YdiL (CAAX protease family)
MMDRSVATRTGRVEPPGGRWYDREERDVNPRRIQVALVVYGLLAMAALGWGLLRGNLDLYHHPDPWLRLPFPYGTALSLALGLAVALMVIAGTRALVRRTRWARALHVEFRGLLGPLSAGEIAIFALTSGIAEELFFRGALQPSVGVVVSSFVFGALHIGPGKRFLPWTAWATAMGFVFATLYALTGEILAPLIAHVAINYENMHFIAAYDPEPAAAGEYRRDAPTTPLPRLVASRMRRS